MIPLPDQTPPPQDLVNRLRDAGLIGAGAQFRTLYGGRTNQVWKVLGGDGDKVLKLYRANPCNPLFRNDPELEARCLRALEQTGFVPRLRTTGTHGQGHWVFYDHAPGSPWSTGPEAVGALLRDLHDLKIPVQAPAGSNGSADLEAHTLNILSGCESAMKARLNRMRPMASVPPSHQTCLIHGDPVAGNILVDGSALTLIDWQCPAQGDPCEDLAMFLSPAMQQVYRGAPLTPDEENAFLAAYNHPATTSRYLALRPWYAWRMAAYCLWRIERGAEDYAKGLEMELASL